MEPADSDYPPVFLISLERSAERRKRTFAQLQLYPGPIEWVKGVDGFQLNRAERRQCSPWRAFLRYNRPMTPGEFGCALAHLRALDKFIETGAPECVIIEDDINVKPEFFDLLETRKDWITDDYGIINFSYDMAEPHPLKPIPGVPGFAVCEFSSIVARTGSYFIRREAAIRILETGFPVRMVMDDLIGDRSIHSIPVFGTLPRAIDWAEDIPSEIWTSGGDSAEKFRQTVRGRILRCVRRLILLIPGISAETFKC